MTVSPSVTLNPIAAARPRSPHCAAVIDGLPISLDSRDAVLAEMARAIAAGERGHYISITNTESMYHGLRIPGHGEYIRQADFSLCDGVGVIVSGWAWGYNLTRYNGPVLQLDCSAYGIPRRWRHYFYGGKEGVAQEMAHRLQQKFPGLIVCGMHTPPFRQLSDAEREAIIEEINNAEPDIVWVGLGLLKQESWIAEHLGRVKATWMVGVGAAFDYHAGVVPWAPNCLRAMGLEWLFRLVIQPRLRARRYWWSATYVVEALAKGVFTGQFRRFLAGWPWPASHNKECRR